MPDQTELLAQLVRLGAEIDRRTPLTTKLDEYYDSNHPLPPLVQKDRDLARAYQTLMRLSRSNWPKLIVDSAEERLEVQGIRFDDDAADETAWGFWQDNGLDAEQSLLHKSVLTDGRAFAIVWGDGSSDPKPVITYEHASLAAVEYVPGSRRQRRGGLRRWHDAGRWYATLYRPEGLYKFESTKASSESSPGAPDKDGWKRRDVKGETWPLKNPFEVVNMVEFAVNRTLRPAPFGTACGEFEPHLEHIDRINYKVFCGLVAMTWSASPLRALIGDPIERDDDDNPKKPFDAAASSVVQIENPEGKLVQLEGAKLEAFSPEMDIKHLAALTKTPAHYLLAEMINLSADAIRAGEAALISKTRGHHRPLGESHEEVSRLAFRVVDPSDPRGFDQRAQVIWKDPESRSLAERADAAVKLNEILPWQAIATYVLGATPQEIDRWQSMRSSDALTQIAAAVGAGVVPARNGATG